MIHSIDIYHVDTTHFDFVKLYLLMKLVNVIIRSLTTFLRTGHVKKVIISDQSLTLLVYCTDLPLLPNVAPSVK